MAVGKWKEEKGGGASMIVPKAILPPAELPKVTQINSSLAPYQLLYTLGEGVVAAKARSTWRYLVASIPSYAAHLNDDRRNLFQEELSVSRASVQSNHGCRHAPFEEKAPEMFRRPQVLEDRHRIRHERLPASRMGSRASSVVTMVTVVTIDCHH